MFTKFMKKPYVTILKIVDIPNFVVTLVLCLVKVWTVLRKDDGNTSVRTGECEYTWWVTSQTHHQIVLKSRVSEKPSG